MHMIPQRLSWVVAVVVLSCAGTSAQEEGSRFREAIVESTRQEPAVLWRNPTDISSRDLYYGIGGKKHAPHPPFVFEDEDRDGTNPKFNVRDKDGVKWKVKLGEEARPETAATRLVWAAGYSADEDYYFRQIQVSNMPDHLHRGADLVLPGGIICGARLERHRGKSEKKIGVWKWKDNPFYGTREFNGLRVVMALVNNWDLKDINNSILEETRHGETYEDYRVTDLGATFGTAGRVRTKAASKGDYLNFAKSDFITKVSEEYVDFKCPAKPSAFFMWLLPPEYIWRAKLTWIGKRIPRNDARWMGQILAQLSTKQIRDAFIAAGYSTYQVDGYTQIIERRIAELNRL